MPPTDISKQKKQEAVEAWPLEDSSQALTQDEESHIALPPPHPEGIEKLFQYGRPDLELPEALKEAIVERCSQATFRWGAPRQTYGWILKFKSAVDHEGATYQSCYLSIEDEMYENFYDTKMGKRKTRQSSLPLSNGLEKKAPAVLRIRPLKFSGPGTDGTFDGTFGQHGSYVSAFYELPVGRQAALREWVEAVGKWRPRIISKSSSKEFNLVEEWTFCIPPKEVPPLRGSRALGWTRRGGREINYIFALSLQEQNLVLGSSTASAFHKDFDTSKTEKRKRLLGRQKKYFYFDNIFNISFYMFQTRQGTVPHQAAAVCGVEIHPVCPGIFKQEKTRAFTSYPRVLSDEGHPYKQKDCRILNYIEDAITETEKDAHEAAKTQKDKRSAKRGKRKKNGEPENRPQSPIPPELAADSTSSSSESESDAASPTEQILEQPDEYPEVACSAASALLKISRTRQRPHDLPEDDRALVNLLVALKPSGERPEAAPSPPNQEPEPGQPERRDVKTLEVAHFMTAVAGGTQSFESQDPPKRTSG